MLLSLLTTLLTASCDAPEPWLLGFQDGASPSFEGIIELHHTIFFYLLVIGITVLWILGNIVISFVDTRAPIAHRYNNHGTLIEVVWTIVPAFILVAIAFPSFKLLYLMDEVVNPALTVKAIGHQWYWSYELSDFAGDDSETVAFDSYMVPESDLELGQLRLLEVDNRLVLPVNTHLRVIVTATDVLHDWAVPALGIKVDACPGRLNQVSTLIQRTGVYYGQCSELCGAYHAFMPIVIEATDLVSYLAWLKSQG